MLNLDDIANEIKKMGLLIDAPERLLTVYSHPKGDGTPHIEIRDGECFYISSERGYEIFRTKISSLDELLYRVFDRVTRRMAGEYELKNRIAGQDSRRIIFHRKLELLRTINSDWETLEKKKIEEILRKNPYIDQA